MYGGIKQIKEHPTQENDLKKYIKNYGLAHSNIAKNKTKMAAWFVTNCNSKSGREQYVKDLQKHLNVSARGNK